MIKDRKGNKKERNIRCASDLFGCVQREWTTEKSLIILSISHLYVEEWMDSFFASFRTIINCKKKLRHKKDKYVELDTEQEICTLYICTCHARCPCNRNIKTRSICRWIHRKKSANAQIIEVTLVFSYRCSVVRRFLIFRGQTSKKY